MVWLEAAPRRIQGRAGEREAAAEGDCGRWMQRGALLAPGRQKHAPPPTLQKKPNNLLIYLQRGGEGEGGGSSVRTWFCCQPGSSLIQGLVCKSHTYEEQREFGPSDTGGALALKITRKFHKAPRLQPTGAQKRLCTSAGQVESGKQRRAAAPAGFSHDGVNTLFFIYEP